MKDQDPMMVLEPRERVAARIRATTAAWTLGVSLAEIRVGLEALLAGPTPGEVCATELAGLPATLARMPRAPEDAVILFCHGGGFQIGSTRSHRSLMCRLAEASGVTVLGFDYRLAPEHRFPAATEDCLAAYRALLSQGYRGRRVIVAGDSAGGNLALGLVQQARDHGFEAPAGLVLISPWLDLTMRGESYASRAEQDIFSKPAQLRAMARTYLGREGDPSQPLATPLEASLVGLPPLLVHAGDFDITRDDSVLLAERAQAAGTSCTLRIWPEMYHHFQVFAELPEAGESLAEIGAFVRARLGLAS